MKPVIGTRFEVFGLPSTIRTCLLGLGKILVNLCCDFGRYPALSFAACTASAFLFIQAKQRNELVVLPLLRDMTFFI